ncbi:MAG: QueG-associated DUF1730 domain-containing protein [Patescibacteria group bacterium]
MDNSQKILLRNEIEVYAKSLGFDMVGFSPAKIENKYLEAFSDWLKNDRHADMSYMEKIEQRSDMSKLLPGAQSVIVLIMNYYHEQKPLTAESGRVARYAYGRDYHKVIGKKLKQIEKFIRALSAQAAKPLTRSYVDTGPILERALAEQAGLGRIGKNSCFITEKFGSWVFISEIITTLDLTNISPSDTKLSPGRVSSSVNHPTKAFPGTLSHSFGQPASPRWSSPQEKSFNVCGNCTKCMQACPTGAIIAPGVVDARLCISYLTIENKGDISPELAKIISKTKRLYGCDICQEVCPHNDARQKDSHKISTVPNQGLFTPIAGDELSLNQLKSLKTDDEFLHTFAGSPLMRAKRKGLQRNAKVLLSKKN